MPSIKGTASIASDASRNKLLRSTKFPSSFSQQIDTSKINTAVITLWIEKEIENILGFEDEIVASMAVNLFFPKVKTDDDINAPVTYGKVDPRCAQLDLVGFLGDEQAAKFATELWEMMLDAQSQPRGIPRVLIEQKKAEIEAQKAAIAHSNLNEKSSNPLVAEASRRAEAARQAYMEKQSRQHHNNNNNNNIPHQPDRAYANRNHEAMNRHRPRPVSPQHSLPHGNDDSRRNDKYQYNGRHDNFENRNRFNQDYQLPRQSSNHYENESSGEDSYGRRRHRSSTRKRDTAQDNHESERKRRSRKHSSRRRRRSRSRSRSRDSRSRDGSSSRKREKEQDNHESERNRRDKSRTSSRRHHRHYSKERRYDESGSKMSSSRRNKERDYSRKESGSTRHERSRSSSSERSR